MIKEYRHLKIIIFDERERWKEERKERKLILMSEKKRDRDNEKERRHEDSEGETKRNGRKTYIKKSKKL